MAAPNHPNTGPARRMVITDRGRRALAFDQAGIALPASYHAWGATDSPVCENGHLRSPHNRMSDGGCNPCRWIGVSQHRRAAA